MKRSAFTMIELVFVIVVLGILAGIAIPKLAATRTDAKISKGKADVSAIRSSIAMTRSQNLLRGDNSYPDLNGSSPTELFGGVLDYPIKAGASGWNSNDNGKLNFSYKVDNDNTITFAYNQGNGLFTCDGLNGDANTTKGKLCITLTQ